MNALGVMGLLWSVIKLVLKNELVNAALDNWAKGTSNKWDDLVWRLIEEAAGIEDHGERMIVLNNGLQKIQADYNYEKIVAPTELKKATHTWDTADIRTFIAGVDTGVIDSTTG